MFVVFQSDGRLASRERRGGVWTLRYLTSPGLRQQAVAATPYRSAYTAFGVSSSSNRLYAITVS